MTPSYLVRTSLLSLYTVNQLHQMVNQYNNKLLENHNNANTIIIPYNLDIAIFLVL